MNITLTPEQAEFVRSKLASGQYQNANEVVEAALRVMQQHFDIIEQQAQQLTELRQEIEMNQDKDQPL